MHLVAFCLYSIRVDDEELWERRDEWRLKGSKIDLKPIFLETHTPSGRLKRISWLAPGASPSPFNWSTAFIHVPIARMLWQTYNTCHLNFPQRLQLLLSHCTYFNTTVSPNLSFPVDKSKSFQWTWSTDKWCKEVHYIFILPPPPITWIH